MMCVCVWSNESNNIPTEAPWEAQVVLQVWGHQGLDRSDATDGGLSDIRMVVTSSTTASATEVVLPTSSCTEHPKIELPFVHDIAYRKDTIAMLNAIIYAQLCAQMHSLFRTHVSFFFVSVAAAVEFVWQPWQQGGGRQVGDVHSFQARRFGSLEVLILDSKKGMRAPFPKRHWNLIPVMTDHDILDCIDL